MSRKTATVAGLFVSLASLAGLSDSSMGSPLMPAQSGPPTTSPVPQLRACRVETLTLPDVPVDASDDAIPDSFETTLTLGDETVRVRLHRHSLRAPNATLLVDVGGNVLVPQPLPPARTYRGEIVGEPGSGVAASLVNGGLLATVDRVNHDRWHVEPLSNLVLPAGVGDAMSFGGAHVSYRGDDVLPSGGTCGVDTMNLQGLVRRPPAGAGSGQGPGGRSDGHDHGGDHGGDHDRGASTDDGAVDGNGGEGGVAGTIQSTSSRSPSTRTSSTTRRTRSSLTARSTTSSPAQPGRVHLRDVTSTINYELTTFVVRARRSAIRTPTREAGDLLCEFRNQWNGVARDSTSSARSRSSSPASRSTAARSASRGSASSATRNGNNCGELRRQRVLARRGEGVLLRVAQRAHRAQLPRARPQLGRPALRRPGRLPHHVLGPGRLRRRERFEPQVRRVRAGAHRGLPQQRHLRPARWLIR
jgi:hypothetical protein